jgi:hypothetical protein
MGRGVKAGKSARDKNKARAQCECVGDAPHSCVYRTKGVCLARDVIQRETGGYQEFEPLFFVSYYYTTTRWTFRELHKKAQKVLGPEVFLLSPDPPSFRSIISIWHVRPEKGNC